jgi:tetratricopeptide (TPR) repeat protein
MLAAIAAQRGADAAQQKAQQLGLGADERRAALVAAVTYLDWARLYPQAKALLAAGGEGGEGDGNTAQAKAYIEALGKIQRYEDATCAPDDPRRPVQELCIGMLLGGKRKEQAKALFVKKATDEERLEAMRIVHAHFQPCRKSDPQHERPVQSSLDAVFMSTMAVVGDKEGGYRVDIRGPLVKAFACYTVFEEGAYRLLAHDGSPACLGAAALERLAAGDKRGAKQWLDWAWQEEQPEFAWFNPFTASPFAHLWRGAEQEQAEPIRLAAAALLCESTRPNAAAIAVLLEAQKQSPSDGRALHIDRALAQAYTNSKQWKELLEVADRMLKDRPRAAELHWFRLLALRQLDRREEARQWVRMHLEQVSASPACQESLAWEASVLGEFDIARKVLQRLADGGKGPYQVWQALAWHAVICGRVDQQALDDALKAARRAPAEREAAALATVAVVYAELGKTAEALEYLGQATDAAAGEIASTGWYVLGRIAEQNNLRSISADLYRKVLPAAELGANDPYLLAQRRLKALE